MDIFGAPGKLLPGLVVALAMRAPIFLKRAVNDNER